MIDDSRSTLENLEALGYFIYKESPEEFGKLRQVADHTKGFVWNGKKGQRHYDMVGALLYKHIQEEIVNTYGLKEVWIPDNKKLMEVMQTDDEEEVKGFPRSNIDMSPDFLPDH